MCVKEAETISSPQVQHIADSGMSPAPTGTPTTVAVAATASPSTSRILDERQNASGTSAAMNIGLDDQDRHVRIQTFCTQHNNELQTIEMEQKREQLLANAMRRKENMDRKREQMEAKVVLFRLAFSFNLTADCCPACSGGEAP